MTGGTPDTATPQPAVTRTGRLRAWFAGLGFSQMWQLVVIAVLGATALFGGLDTVDTTVTPVKTGEAFSDGKFTVTVERARTIDELKAGYRTIWPLVPGRTNLAIVTTLRNDGHVPASLDNEIDLRLPDKKFVGVYRLADSRRATRLGPGLTEQLVYAWSVPADAVAEGDSVTVRIWKKKFSELMVTYGTTWVDSLTDYATVSIPVTRAKA
jgi:hypothetical protein